MTPLTQLQTDVSDDYNKKTIKSVDALKKFDVSATGEAGHVSVDGEGKAAEGIVKISTTYTQDNSLKTKLDALQQTGKDYNACYNNCSSFVQDGLKALFPKFDASQKVLPPGDLQKRYKDASVVAPNNVYNAALQLKGSSTIKGPAKVDAKPFLNYFLKANRTN